MTNDHIQVSKTVRKDFANHLLPSEAAAQFADLSGERITQLLVGLLNISETNSRKPAPSEISSVYILFESRRAVEFRLDGQSGSLGVIFFEEVSNPDELLAEIKKREDSFPRFFRTNHLMDVSEVVRNSGPISSVTAYKLPDNYEVRFAKSLCKNERIVCLGLEQSKDLLVVCRVTESSGPAPQFIRWEDVPTSFPSSILEKIF